MKVLVVDVGGTNCKILATGQEEIRKTPSGPAFGPEQMVEKVLAMAHGWEYEAVTIGYPGPVIQNRPALEPVNIGPGWVDFDFGSRFGKPVKVINDAAMQAMGSYQGGRMLFVGLGTGMGTAMIIDKVVAPMELGHLPYRKRKSFEDYVGTRGLQRLGKKKWRAAVEDVVGRLQAALIADYVVLGGGNVKKLDRLPPGTRPGDNRPAFEGGFRLWTGEYHGV